jgi:integrase
VRRLLPSTLLAKPVALLTSVELRHWRDGLLATLKAASVTRYCKSFKAALNLAAAHDPRIANSATWKLALAGLPDANVARRVGLSEANVRALVRAAYALDRTLGLWVETAAITGARPSQLAKLNVEDLQDGPAPRLMMPSSLKGRGRKRSERRPVPIPPKLAAKLRATSARPLDVPLLTKEDGTRWRRIDHSKSFARVAALAGIAGTTAYALRHSSIIRTLLANVPTRVVASMHDTSVAIIESNYGRFISDHSDDVSRRALPDLSET